MTTSGPVADRYLFTSVDRQISGSYMARVRCHALIGDGTVRLRNVIIAYPSDELPDQRHGGEIISTPVEVMEMGFECHSTVDFNGVAEIGVNCDSVRFIPLSDLQLQS